MPVLILYNTDHGSTAEIASRIASRIDAVLPPTEVHNLHDFDATTLPNYTAVILGSAVHGAKWLPEANTFCDVHKETLITKPVYAFSAGAPGALPKVFRNWCGNHEEKAIFEGLKKRLDGKVRMHRLFSGKIEREDLPGGLRMCCGLFGGMRYGDLREWDKIEAWADEVAADLKRDQEEGRE
ncbi:flavodoxin-like protein [Lentithecium fluviatile CBS 122367]|uniref:Flavodoxin-like protein n=1 Tax=Lentithecium fluviatile CBS 122367 TaxID=1168545 RepID=A0A6G1JEB7_9PLEO|nr:flavodoxin-like protein [Lentithecium fluviatile CBS 122367]